MFVSGKIVESVRERMTQRKKVIGKQPHVPQVDVWVCVHWPCRYTHVFETSIVRVCVCVCVWICSNNTAPPPSDYCRIVLTFSHCDCKTVAADLEYTPSTVAGSGVWPPHAPPVYPFVWLQLWGTGTAQSQHLEVDFPFLKMSAFTPPEEMHPFIKHC